jgi:hypothetical protein
MPIVPNAPGVPTLTSYATSSLTALIGDAFDAVAGLLAPKWGIFIDGLPVITPASRLSQSFGEVLSTISQVASLIGIPNVVPTTASFISFEYSGDAPVSSYQQERGAFQSYDKVTLPFDGRVRLACGGGVAERQAFFTTLDALKNSTALVDIVTPEAVYTSCNCKHVDYRRRSDQGVNLVVADLTFEEIREVSATSFTNTRQPTDSAPQSTGNVQAQDAPGGVTQIFNGTGGAPY